MKTGKKILALALSLILALSALPITALALQFPYAATEANYENLFALAYDHAPVFENQATNRATKTDGSRFRTSFDYTLHNVTTGNSVSYNYAAGDKTDLYEENWGKEYLNTYQYGDELHASTATLEVDRSKYDDVGELGCWLDWNVWVHGPSCYVGTGMLHTFDPKGMFVTTATISPFGETPILQTLTGNHAADGYSVTVTGSDGHQYPYRLSRFHRSAEDAEGNITAVDVINYDPADDSWDAAAQGASMLWPPAMQETIADAELGRYIQPDTDVTKYGPMCVTGSTIPNFDIWNVISWGYESGCINWENTPLLITGPAPEVGETAKVRVAVHTGVKLDEDNHQILNGWTDLTIVGTCSHSKGFSYACHGDGTHTATCVTCGATFEENCTGLTPTNGICDVCGGSSAYGVLLDPCGATSGGDEAVIAVYGQQMPPFTLPEKTGYHFGGYFTEQNGGGDRYYNADGSSACAFDQTADGLELYALWIPNEDTAYTVEHYYMDPSGSYDGVTPESETKYGTTASTVTHSAVAQEKPYFTLDTDTSGTQTGIAPDGSTVIRLYYQREKFTLSLGTGSGVTDTLGAGEYYYGAPVTATAILNDGWNFTGWTSSDPTLLAGSDSAVYSFTMPGGNVTLTPAAEIRTYSVSVAQNDTAYTLNEPAGSVDWGGSYTFTITLNPAYTQSELTLRDETGAALAASREGDTYTCTISDIKKDYTVSVEGVGVNEYTAALTGGVGSAAAPGASPIVYGGSYTFTVVMDPAYSQTVPTAVINGETVTLVPTGNENEYSYTVENVTTNLSIRIADAQKNAYSVVLPAGAGYACAAAEGTDLSHITHGAQLVFTVALEAQYNRSDYKVYYNDALLTPGEGGVYTVTVTGPIAEGGIRVENVTLNKYYIALALDALPGYTVEPVPGCNPRATVSGGSFSFRVRLDPAYSDSVPAVSYTANGGQEYLPLTADADGVYTIDSVLSDCIVTVEGVAINTYTVIFTDGEGNELERHENVEYGSSVSFGGTEPAKADALVSETTVTNQDESETLTRVTRTFVFAGWSASSENVTRDLTLEPRFEVYEVTETITTKNGEELGHETVTEPGFVTFTFLNDDASVLYQESVEKGQPFAGYAETPQKTASNPYASYVFLGWDADGDGVADIQAGDSTAVAAAEDGAVYTAVYEYLLGKQHLRFYSYDGDTLLYEADYDRGEVAVYGGDIPARRDAANEYVFAGWSYATDGTEADALESLLVADADLSLYACYRAVPIRYTYRFICDGETLEEGGFYYGEAYAYSGETPAREGSVSTSFVFDHWYNELQGYVEIHTAVFTETPRVYPVSFTAGDGVRTEGAPEAVYGSDYTFRVKTDASCSGQSPTVMTAGGTTLAPVSVDDNAAGGKTYVYTLAVEAASVAEAEALLTISASCGKNVYTVRFENEDGSLLKAVFVSYGETPVYDGATPEKAAGEQVEYVFNGWNPALTPAFGDATYTATFREVPRTFTVTFKNYDGSVLYTDRVAYGGAASYGGRTPVRPDADGVRYTFYGWSEGGENVTSDRTLTAQYTETSVQQGGSSSQGGGTFSFVQWILAIFRKIFARLSKHC